MMDFLLGKDDSFLSGFISLNILIIIATAYYLGFGHVNKRLAV